MGLYVTLSITGLCDYAEGRILFIIMLNVITHCWVSWHRFNKPFVRRNCNYGILSSFAKTKPWMGV